MKTYPKGTRLLNELIFAVRVRRGRATITVENASPRDGAFCGAVAKLLELWINRTWRST